MKEYENEEYEDLNLNDMFNELEDGEIYDEDSDSDISMPELVSVLPEMSEEIEGELEDLIEWNQLGMGAWPPIPIISYGSDNRSSPRFMFRPNRES